MSQKNTQQTRIDHFYKVVWKRNTGCGIKLVNQKFHHQVDSYGRGVSTILFANSNFVEFSFLILFLFSLVQHFTETKEKSTDNVYSRK